MSAAVTRSPLRSHRLLFAALACLLCAAFAHASHWHDLDTPGGGTQPLCELCVGFDRIIDTPAHPPLVLLELTAEPSEPFRLATAASVSRVPLPQPRAPPLD